MSSVCEFDSLPSVEDCFCDCKMLMYHMTCASGYLVILAIIIVIFSEILHIQN